MLNKISKKINLVVTKENKYRILLLLGINLFFKLKLSFTKWFKGVKTPIIHYYCISWNESELMPFIYQYYQDFVDKFFIYDNESNDETKTIIEKLPKAHYRVFSTQSKFNDEVHVKLKNSIWKNSRGKADYVIVCDTDEVLYHKHMKTFLKDSLKAKFTFFTPKGYDMYSEKFPVIDLVNCRLITDQIENGIQNNMYSKPILFDPHKIIEINYLPGAHQAFPVGIIKSFQSEDLKLLHYKNLGIDYVLNRIKQYRKRLSDTNIEKGYGIEYLNEDQKIIMDFNFNLEKSKTVI